MYWCIYVPLGALLIDEVVHMCTDAYWVWYKFSPIRVSTISCYVSDGVYTFVLHILSFYLVTLSCTELLTCYRDCGTRQTDALADYCNRPSGKTTKLATVVNVLIDFKNSG